MVNILAFFAHPDEEVLLKLEGFHRVFPPRDPASLDPLVEALRPWLYQPAGGL